MRNEPVMVRVNLSGDIISQHRYKEPDMSGLAKQDSNGQLTVKKPIDYAGAYRACGDALW